MTVRRLLAALLIPIFIGLFLASVLGLRVNSTAFEPEFYSGVLEEAGTIDFVYDVGIPEVMREAEESGGFSFEDDLPLGLGLTPGLVEEALPREWVAENVNRAIVEVVPYFGGETDSFEVTIPINERVDEAEAVARRLLREAELHTFLIEAVVRPAARPSA
jgi:16S rRNA C1402 N4-methylase RsmH